MTSVTDALSHTTSYGYDLMSNLTSISDASSRVTDFEYDDFNRLTKIIYPPAFTGAVRLQKTLTYDAAGNITKHTDTAGRDTNYVYDSVNRLTKITNPALEVTRFQYNARSQQTAGIDALNQQYSFVYDSLDRMTQATRAGTSMNYTYDAVGNLIESTDYNGALTTYDYDDLNRLTRVNYSDSTTATYDYDVVNRLTSRVAPNDIATSFNYDDLDRLFKLSHTKSPATLSIHQYGYNDANNLVSWLGSGGNRSFNYDNADRLISVLKMGGNESYGYDAVGNRTSSHLSTSYTYEAFNKVTATTSTTYTYDNNGNLLTKTDGSGTRTLAWDPENRLKQVNLPGSLTTTYKYDALGRRTQRTTSAGADERYVYDGPDVVADLNSSSAVVTTYFNGPGIDDHLRQTNTTTGVSYFLTDHLGTTAALTDANGAIVETLAYDSFGNHAGSTRTRYTYTGRERDPDTGLLYYRARFYDPQLGRFISADPIGFAGGDINLYGYVWQNPVRFTDPSGLDGYDEDIGFLSLMGSYGRGVIQGIGSAAIGTIRLPIDLIRNPVDTVGGITGDLGMRARTFIDIASDPSGAKDAIIDSIITLGPNHSMEILGGAGGQVIFARGAASSATYVGNMARYGREIKLGSNCRIAPFGNRTNPPHPTGRFPHYHRRVPDPKKPGQGKPSQGLTRHRPWEKKPDDTSWRDRF